MKKRFKSTQFANDLATWRQSKGFNLFEAGDCFGVSHMQIWRIETKKSVIPYADLFLLICFEMGKEPLSYLED